MASRTSKLCTRGEDFRSHDWKMQTWLIIQERTFSGTSLETKI